MIKALAFEREFKAIWPSVCLYLPNGQRIGDQVASVVLHVKDHCVLRHLKRGNIGALAGDYVEDRLNITGSPRNIALMAASLISKDPTHAPNPLKRLASYARSKLCHTLQADSAHIQRHYDLSDEFYALWLDPKRVYSCAYFTDERMPLEQAQEAKLDLICRKLMLQSGDRFLDIGAGWGGLLFHAAENYGVQATGITLSKNQHARVLKLIEEKGLVGRVRMKLLDYRELTTAKYDKIASVGMFEHVGRANLPAYFRKLHSLLRPGGLLLNHGITAGGVKNRELGGGMGNFIEKYIFPGGELHHLSHVIEKTAEAGLEVLDVENLRPHYAKTLWAWSDALERNQDQAREIVGEKVLRAYRLYLAGCAVNFERGWISLHQVLSSRSQHDNLSDYPFTRDYMYR